MLAVKIKKFIRNNLFTNFLYEFSIIYPSPSNLNYFWNFGFLSLIFFILQIVTGFFLSMFYTPQIDLAFFSIEHIMRDVNYGYLLRYLHSNGASAFFLLVYLHILKGLYYGSFSYPRLILWLSGVLILVIMILTAFMGYVLIWGQMSFWAATVITNLFSVIPYFGNDFVLWVWGGFSVDNPTLNRFFSLHFLMPFILLGLVIFHLLCLHNWGSNNPLGFNLKVDLFSFSPFFFVKDFMSLFFFLFFFFYFVFFSPNFFGHSDNYILANSLITPQHIVPEWYFLPFYAILRALPDKNFGVIFFLFAILILFIFPFYINLSFRSSYFKPVFQSFFWIFVLVVLSLGWIGGKPVEPVYYFLSQILTFFYFFFFIVILLVFSKFDIFFLEYRLFFFFKKKF